MTDSVGPERERLAALIGNGQRWAAALRRGEQRDAAEVMEQMLEALLEYELVLHGARALSTPPEYPLTIHGGAIGSAVRETPPEPPPGTDGLLPCPLCGGDAKFAYAPEESPEAEIMCVGVCGLRLGGVYPESPCADEDTSAWEEMLRTRWNDRGSVPAPTEEPPA